LNFERKAERAVKETDPAYPYPLALAFIFFLRHRRFISDLASAPQSFRLLPYAATATFPNAPASPSLEMASNSSAPSSPSATDQGDMPLPPS
jgi:hypothetical protein